MTKRLTVVDKCAIGEVSDFNETVADAVGEWHDMQERVPPLHKWLGMSWDEYKLWVQDASYLKVIIKNRRDLKK